MTHFSNGTDAEIYQANWCHRCEHFKPDPDKGSLGCPVLNMHFDHAGDEAWRIHLDEMIPPVDGPQWHGECAFFSEVNMKPDRLYQPPTPSWINLLVKARYELGEMAELCEEWVEDLIAIDGHAYALDDPDHVCDEKCPDDTRGNTSLWLHQMWSKELKDEITAYLTKHGQAQDPQAVEMAPGHRY